MGPARGHPRRWARTHPSIGDPITDPVVPTVVTLRPDAPGHPPGHPHDERLGALLHDAVEAGRDVGRGLDLAVAWGARLPRPGHGDTLLLWEALATLGAVDLQVARAVEPHLDALAILHELDGRGAPAGTTWGVFAAEGPGVRLEVRADPDDPDGSTYLLDGTKPWCSLADRLTHALLTAWDGDARRLLAVDLHQDAVRPGGDAAADAGGWVARGLPGVRSTSLQLHGARGATVGEPGWYLRRDGFAWGGIGVAAVWFGGAVGVARTLHAAARRRGPDQVGLMHLGAVDVALHVARVTLADAAAAVDAGRAGGEAGALLALRVRAVVAASVEEVMRRTDHALGPAPLVRDEEHAARGADLHLYVRQHHGERDLATLGRVLTS